MLRAKALNRLKAFHWRRLFASLKYFGSPPKHFANDRERLEYQHHRQLQKAEASMKHRPF